MHIAVHLGGLTKCGYISIVKISYTEDFSKRKLPCLEVPMEGAATKILGHRGMLMSLGCSLEAPGIALTQSLSKPSLWCYLSTFASVCYRKI